MELEQHGPAKSNSDQHVSFRVMLYVTWAGPLGMEHGAS